MPDITAIATLEDGEHRLELLYVPVGSGGLDFHTLRWTESDKLVCEISNNAFQQESPDRRWISGLAKFDSDAGTAIIQVGLQPTDSNTVEYSWREWKLRQNQEGRFLKICNGPFDGAV